MIFFKKIINFYPFATSQQNTDAAGSICVASLPSPRAAGRRLKVSGREGATLTEFDKSYNVGSATISRLSI